MGDFLGLLESGSSGDIISMSPPWHRMWVGTHGASEKVAARPTHGTVRRDCYQRSVSFVHSADPIVSVGFHVCAEVGGGGGSAKEERICRPLGHSSGGNDNNAINFPLRSLQRDSNEGGPPGSLCSSDSAPTLTDSY